MRSSNRANVTATFSVIFNSHHQVGQTLVERMVERMVVERKVALPMVAERMVVERMVALPMVVECQAHLLPEDPASLD
jgi:hypothetical protein